MALLLCAIGASLWALKVAPTPFFWVWLIWAATFIAAMFAVRGKWLRPILFNMGVVAVGLAVIEASLINHGYSRPILTDGFVAQDDVLGWAPAKGTQAHAVEIGQAGLLHHAPGFVFNTTYTIDPNGLRVAPPWRKDDLAGTILFFGCSFTFGEGLGDDETLPYQVGVQSAGRWRTFNFGFDGYSPAQMLAELQRGMVRRVVDTTPQYAFYVAIPQHVWRVAGRVWWGRHLPRYVMDSDGTVRQDGYYDPRTLSDRLGLGHTSHIRGQLDKSGIWRMIAYRDSGVSDEDIRLYLAVVRQSQELLASQFPGIQFHVILWPDRGAPQERYVYESLREGFARMGYPLHLVNEILPDCSTDPSRYLRSADDHPNALADHLVAQYLVDKIIQ